MKLPNTLSLAFGAMLVNVVGCSSVADPAEQVPFTVLGFTLTSFRSTYSTSVTMISMACSE